MVSFNILAVIAKTGLSKSKSFNKFENFFFFYYHVKKKKKKNFFFFFVFKRQKFNFFFNNCQIWPLRATNPKEIMVKYKQRKIIIK